MIFNVFSENTPILIRNIHIGQEKDLTNIIIKLKKCKMAYLLPQFKTQYSIFFKKLAKKLTNGKLDCHDYRV